MSGEPDPLDALRDRLDALDQVALDEHPEAFEAVNAALVDELEHLDALSR